MGFVDIKTPTSSAFPSPFWSADCGSPLGELAEGLRSMGFLGLLLGGESSSEPLSEHNEITRFLEVGLEGPGEDRESPLTRLVITAEGALGVSIRARAGAPMALSGDRSMGTWDRLIGGLLAGEGASRLSVGLLASCRAWIEGLKDVGGGGGGAAIEGEFVGNGAGVDFLGCCGLRDVSAFHCICISGSDFFSQNAVSV